MRYHFQPAEVTSGMYGVTYLVRNHPVYNECTLYKIKELGLSVIQQRYDPQTKHTWWGPIDDALRDPIYVHPKFFEYFRVHAFTPDENGHYPTVTVRQIMWGLRMKPLSREPWETVFDHKDF